MAQTHKHSLLPCISDDVPFVELRQSFPSQIQAISPFVEQLMRFIAKSRRIDGSEMDIEIALTEALENSIVHGNQQNPDKRVYLTCRCTPDGEVSIMIQDDGQGFDTSTLPDPTQPENRLRTSGHGIYLIKASMDKVRFEKGVHLFICARSPMPGQPQRGKQDDTGHPGSQTRIRRGS